MENQHRKIKGYRELSQEEINLMNEIKVKESEIIALMRKLDSVRGHCDNLSCSQISESYRCLGIAQEKIQTGFMWLVRAVALPDK